jgi:hypothetical protein
MDYFFDFLAIYIKHLLGIIGLKIGNKFRIV